MTKKIISLFFVLYSFFSCHAYADNYFIGSRQFLELMEDYKQSCTNGCKKPFHHTLLYKLGEQNVVLSAYEMNAFQKIARKQAYIWIDTILEDQFYADGNTQIEEIIGIVKSSILVGYKVRYFEKAWFIGRCRYNGKDESVLARCLPGLIKESSFVSTDFKTFVRNNDDIAEFYYK